MEEKLVALRASDPFRQWNSLDDERVCFLCYRTFTGRQIEVVRTGPNNYKLNCPTPGCSSSPHEWVYTGNPLTSNDAWKDWERVFKDELPPEFRHETQSMYA